MKWAILMREPHGWFLDEDGEVLTWKSREEANNDSGIAARRRVYPERVYEARPYPPKTNKARIDLLGERVQGENNGIRGQVIAVDIYGSVEVTNEWEGNKYGYWIDASKVKIIIPSDPEEVLRAKREAERRTPAFAIEVNYGSP